MPTQKLRFNRKEQDEYRSRLRQLREIGVPVGSERDSVTDPNRFRLTQVCHSFARVHDLPLGQVAIVLYANLAALKNDVMISESQLIVPWDDFPLDLDDPESTSFYKEIMLDSPHWPPTILNNWLTGERWLPRLKREGAIIAIGWIPVPPKWHDETPVSVELLVRDGQDELCFEFEARVDRSLKREVERKHKERSEALLLKGRTGLYGSKTPERDQHMKERLEHLDVPRGGGGVHGTEDPDDAEAKQTWKRSLPFEGQCRQNRTIK
jgi:hypothetical protein